MKASELRIGNLFYSLDRTGPVHPPTYIPFKVMEIQLFKVKALPENLHPAQNGWTEFDITDLRPIELTAERLERAGFETGTVMANGNTEYYIQEVGKFCGNITFDFYVWQIDGDFFVEMEWEGYCTKIKIPVKCVHQLQNLYFALTGKELEFKPENVKGHNKKK